MEENRQTNSRTREGVRSGGVGIVLNLILFGAKYTCGVLTGSVSIRADAVNNLSDAASSLATFLGFLIAGRRADENHPFGHERFEYITGLFVSCLILSMAFSLLRESAAHLFSGTSGTFSPVVAGVLLLSIGAKLFLYAFNKKRAERLHSEALMAAAKDSLMDVLATSSVLVCGLLSSFTSLRLDGIAGIGISLFILWTGGTSLQATLSPLLGSRPDPELIERITNLLYSAPEVLGMHDLLVHDYGPDRIYVTAHIEIDSSTTLVEAHQLADRLEEMLMDSFGFEATLHIDPVDLSSESLSLVRVRLESILRDYPGVQYHDLQLYTEGSSCEIHFDIAVPFSMKDRDREIRDAVEAELGEALPCASVHTKLDHY